MLIHRLVIQIQLLAGPAEEQELTVEPAEASSGSKASLTGINTLNAPEGGASASSIAASSPPSPSKLKPSQGRNIPKSQEAKTRGQGNKKRTREVSVENEPGKKRQQAKPKASTASTASPGFKRLSKGVKTQSSNLRDRVTPDQATPSTVEANREAGPAVEEQASHANGVAGYFLKGAFGTDIQTCLDILFEKSLSFLYLTCLSEVNTNETYWCPPLKRG